MSQRVVELLIGRLITDAEFRNAFLKEPEATLFRFCDRGLELSRTEVAALLQTDRSLWERTADAIACELRKISFIEARS